MHVKLLQYFTFTDIHDKSPHETYAANKCKKMCTLSWTSWWYTMVPFQTLYGGWNLRSRKKCSDVWSNLLSWKHVLAVKVGPVLLKSSSRECTLPQPCTRKTKPGCVLLWPIRMTHVLRNSHPMGQLRLPSYFLRLRIRQRNVQKKYCIAINYQH